MVLFKLHSGLVTREFSNATEKQSPTLHFSPYFRRRKGMAVNGDGTRIHWYLNFAFKNLKLKLEKKAALLLLCSLKRKRKVHVRLNFLSTNATENVKYSKSMPVFLLSEPRSSPYLACCATFSDVSFAKT